jgi:hypothetical protein
MAAPAVPRAVEKDCQKTGGEVSALIDARQTSSNISAARAIFQAGIMDCMEGDDLAANSHYQDAKNLLTTDQKATLATPVKPAAPAVTAATPVADKGCQKLGGEVSARIDTNGTRRTSLQLGLSFRRASWTAWKAMMSRQQALSGSLILGGDQKGSPRP